MNKLTTIIVFILIALFLVSCDRTPGENIEISSAEISIDLDTLEISTTQKGYNVDLVENEQTYQVKFEAKLGYTFTSNVSIYINGILVHTASSSFTPTHITLGFEDIDSFNPDAPSEVQVFYDLNGGYFTSSYFEENEPNRTLKITSYGDIIGQSFTFFDTSNTALRWFYKLFIRYNETFDSYEVVYKDPATAGIIDLDLPDYDYVLAVHAQTQDDVARINVINYTQEENSRMFVSFDQDISQYESGEITVSFYLEDKFSGKLETLEKESFALPIPVREDFEFLGWESESSIVTTFPGYTNGQNVKTVTYTALWEGATLQELYDYIDLAIPEKALDHLSLPTQYSRYNIEWSSSHEEVINADGVYKRPYLETTVVLTAHITLGDETYTKEYDIQAAGYKSLSSPIASSYIYRNYSSVNKEFFETLDIINTAFIIGQSDGSLIGNHYLDNVAQYIMPEAKNHGNWVLMSVAPESSWSTIAASTTLINTFADNIVEMINTHGFDGVDIDWETPTSSERTRYTNLMRIVYEKVKANNPHHLVTTAITGGQWQPPQYDLLNSGQYIDYINVMTYGMTSGNGQYQNPLYPSSSFDYPSFSAGRTLSSASIAESVTIFTNNYNIPKSKLIFGLAFYGIRQERSFNSSTQTWSTWSNAGSVHYTEIISSYLNNTDYIKRYDTNAGVPYMVKIDGTVFVSYDNPRSIAEKSEYIINQDLGGLMFWEYGTDTTGTLLNALRLGLNK
ncbi:MAG: glycoside hydrolase family 18 protein [Tenericutes bacterium]|nr:glycoside hydrolase family 18 protein [Mycoplasmatota bacterium]